MEPEVGIEDMEQRSRKVIDELRPYLQAEGADVEFHSLDGTTLHIILRGSQTHCGSLLVLLKLGIERRVLQALPSIESVEVA